MDPVSAPLTEEGKGEAFLVAVSEEALHWAGGWREAHKGVIVTNGDVV